MITQSVLEFDLPVRIPLSANISEVKAGPNPLANKVLAGIGVAGRTDLVCGALGPNVVQLRTHVCFVQQIRHTYSNASKDNDRTAAYQDRSPSDGLTADDY